VPAALTGRSVLVVDDNATNRHIFEQLLQKWQMHVTVVDSGEAALVAAERADARGVPFDLVLMDVNMPGMDGFETAARLKAPSRSPTIMMLTSSDQKGDASRCRDIGIKSYLVKPVRQSALRGAMLEALGRTPAASRPGPAAANHTLRTLRVLVAEDNIVNQRVATGILENAGHTVTVVEIGREALDALHAGTFDIVLMDMQMPELSGGEAIAELRRQEHAAGGHVPVIAVTAHALVGDRERCLAGGADGYVPKPMTPAALFAEMGRVIGDAGTPASPAVPLPPGVLARVGGDMGLLREIIALFAEDGPKQLDALTHSIAAHDGAAIYRAAHTLKGAVGNFEAHEIVRMLVTMEERARGGDLPACEALLPPIETAVAELVRSLTQADLLCAS
jgi:CheY-like chemotaxis protein/HPt (histidine-containing phosphotransfer) domain-containing protein